MNLNCAITLSNPSTVIIPLNNGITYNGVIPDLFSGGYFTFTTTVFETIDFTVNISPNTSAPIDGAFTLLILDNGNFVELGTSIIDTFNNQFIYAAQPAEYYICLTSHNSVDYSLVGNFTAFPQTAELTLDCYMGATLAPVDIDPVSDFCDSTVIYTFTAGELPKNVIIETSGRIDGIPEEQDCHPHTTTPSFTWHEDDPNSDGQISTGYDYVFTARATLLDYPDTFVEREFIITVYNNWTLDLLHIQSQREKWVVDRFVNKEDLPNLNDKPTLANTQPAPLITPIVLSEKEVELCETCPAPEVFIQPTISELKELAKQMVILEEFSDIIKINDEGLCVVCPKPEEKSTAAVIAPIKTEEITDCDPCPSVEEVAGLAALPMTMCPPCEVDIPKEEISPAVPVIVPGLPEICYIDLLERMRTEKICDGRPICTPVLNVYPTPKIIQPLPEIILTEQDSSAICPCDP